jgi:hypothetical protein
MTAMPSTQTLFASAARIVAVANSAGTAVDVARARRLDVVLNVTAMGGAVGDTLDVFVDVSPDGATWLNAVHFTQLAGNAAALTSFAIMDPSNPSATVVLATSDCASGVVRPAACGRFVRGRYTLVDAGAHGQSATFSLAAFVQ